jgi:hypothetical protein
MASVVRPTIKIADVYDKLCRDYVQSPDNFAFQPVSHSSTGASVETVTFYSPPSCHRMNIYGHNYIVPLPHTYIVVHFNKWEKPRLSSDESAGAYNFNSWVAQLFFTAERVPSDPMSKGFQHLGNFISNVCGTSVCMGGTGTAEVKIPDASDMTFDDVIEQAANTFTEALTIFLQSNFNSDYRGDAVRTMSSWALVHYLADKHPKKFSKVGSFAGPTYYETAEILLASRGTHLFFTGLQRNPDIWQNILADKTYTKVFAKASSINMIYLTPTKLVYLDKEVSVDGES